LISSMATAAGPTTAFAARPRKSACSACRPSWSTARFSGAATGFGWCARSSAPRCPRDDRERGGKRAAPAENLALKYPPTRSYAVRTARRNSVELRDITFDKAAVATLTVNRPAALNALNRVVLEDIARVLREVRHDHAVRVLIVTGAGDRAFVAGADIAAMSEMSTTEGLEFSRLGHRVMQSFEDLPIPVIAAVNGFALGGGLELAMACDLIIASDKARFGQPEINLALIPGFGGTQRLPHRIGHARAREFVMTGDMFDARTALALGLVNQVVAL